MTNIYSTTVDELEYRREKEAKKKKKERERA